MVLKVSKKIKLGILIPSIVILGFIRDYFFVNINWVYLTLTINRKNAARPEFYGLLEWSVDEILILKWFLTILFFLIYLGMTLWIIHIGFKKRAYNITTLILYAGIFAISGFLYVIGWATGTGGELYAVIHWLMSLTQSFFPLMILGIIFKFLPHSDED